MFDSDLDYGKEHSATGRRLNALRKIEKLLRNCVDLLTTTLSGRPDKKIVEQAELESRSVPT